MPSPNKVCSETPGFSHPNGFEKLTPLNANVHPYKRHCLGRQKRGRGRRRGCIPASSKVCRERPPETTDLLHFLFKTVRSALNDILSNYVAKIQGENYFWVADFGPIISLPTPPLKNCGDAPGHYPVCSGLLCSAKL